MNKNEYKLLISQGEGYNLEFKENYSKNIGRLKISNPGGLAAGLKPEDFGKKKFIKESIVLKSGTEESVKNGCENRGTMFSADSAYRQAGTFYQSIYKGKKLKCIRFL